MAIFDAGSGPVGGMSAVVASSGVVARRFCRWSGANGQVVAPSSGQDVDGVGCTVIGTTGRGNVYLAHAGLPFAVEAGGSFSAGVNLQTDGSGRAVVHSSGTIVARALEASTGGGDVVWAVFTSGR